VLDGLFFSAGAERRAPRPLLHAPRQLARPRIARSQPSAPTRADLSAGARVRQSVAKGDTNLAVATMLSQFAMSAGCAAAPVARRGHRTSHALAR